MGTQGLDAVTQGVVAPYGHYYGKRAAEAEPEADPQYLAYGGLGYSGYSGFAGLPYSSYGYAGYPYTQSPRPWTPSPREWCPLCLQELCGSPSALLTTCYHVAMFSLNTIS